MIIRTKSFPRAALVGNPSDGYYGKTIAFVFSNFHSQVTMYESPELDLLPSLRDHTTFEGLDHLVRDVSVHGYYGGIRLLKAAIYRFCRHCEKNGITLEKRNFTMRYKTTIPNRLGLAGSSAIITCAIRSLMRFYEVKMSEAELANLVLSVERKELGIPAGLQDRVAQAYNVPVYMDFNKKHMEEYGYGIYKKIEIPEGFNCYVAYRTDLAEGSEVLHNRLRCDFEEGVPAVVDAMCEWAELTDKVLSALEKKEFDKIPAFLDRNFDLRREVCAAAISPLNLEMVQAARSVGASAKFTGSGGAIIGTYEDDKMFEKLKKTLRKKRIEVIKPEIVTDSEKAFNCA